MTEKTSQTRIKIVRMSSQWSGSIEEEGNHLNMTSQSPFRGSSASIHHKQQWCISFNFSTAPVHTPIISGRTEDEQSTVI